MAFRPTRPCLARWLRFLPLAALAVFLSGCRTAGYYAQAIHGQFQIVHRQQPIPCLIADPQTSPELRAKLELVERLRTFAKDQLKLPVDDHYCRYADLQRPFVVWNVQAAPKFSLAAKTWWYPFVGQLEYRGFFAEKDAQDCAQRLKQRGFDVSVDGVEAYSTLGWFKDPVLNTFIDHPEPELAEIIFHELAHQRLFVAGDTDFNEAFATAVGEEGARQWLRAQGETNLFERYETALGRNRQFVRLMLRTRSQLEKLYGDAEDESGRLNAATVPHASSEVLSRGKEQAFEALRQEYAKLKSSWNGWDGYDTWFAPGLNNARLNTVANYYELVPGFQRRLAASAGDWEQFYQAVERLGKLPQETRHERLSSVDVGKTVAIGAE